MFDLNKFLAVSQLLVIAAYSSSYTATLPATVILPTAATVATAIHATVTATRAAFTATPVPFALSNDQAVKQFDFDQSLPADITERPVKNRDGVAVHDIYFTSLATGRTLAYLIVPPGKGPFAAIFFMRWLGTPLGLREEFLDEAFALAEKGTVSLLINSRFPYLIPAYVGHDHGAMHAAILAGLDKSIKASVLMTGTTNFSDWALKYWSPANGDH